MATQSDLLKRFISYANVDSRSEMGSDKTPSTYGQTKMIMLIMRELLAAGIDRDQMLNLSDGSLLVHFAGTGEGKTTCWAAHVDTFYGLPGNAKPLAHNYEGGEINLASGYTISVEDLKGKEGKTIVTSDGFSVLGADDKSGVAILTQIAVDILKGEIQNHGPIYIWFCVDEEIGRLDINAVPSEILESWDILITVDGGDPKEIVTECFCFKGVKVEFFGENAHSAFQGHKLKPAHYAACRLVIELEDISIPLAPWNSFGRDGLIYAEEIGPTTQEGSKVGFCMRSFEPKKLFHYQAMVEAKVIQTAKRYGVRFIIHYEGISCMNIKKAIDAYPDLLAPIVSGFKQTGIDASPCSGRYSTDGAMINVIRPKLPAPDIGTGGYNVHSRREFLVVEEMYAVYQAIKAMLPMYLKE